MTGIPNVHESPMQATRIVAALFGVKIVANVLSAAAVLWNFGAAVIPMAIRGVMLLLPVLWKLVAGFMALNLANPLFWIVAKD